MEDQQTERGFRAGTRPSAQSAGPPEARPRGHAELSGHKARAGQGEERKLLLEASVRFGLQNKAPARGDATAPRRTLPGLPALRKSPAARRPAALTPLAWPQSLREYGFAHCGGAAPQPSLLGGSSPPPCADWWRTEARLLIGQQRSHSGRLRWGGRPGVISWASDTPRRQQRAGALWRRRRVPGGGCSGDSSELSVSGHPRLLPPPSLPLFCFPFPFPLPSLSPTTGSRGGSCGGSC